MKCNKCGNELAENEKFCGSCGAPVNKELEWYYANGDQPVGAFTSEEMASNISSGAITAETLIWNETLPEWIAVKNSEFAQYVPIEGDTNNTQQWYCTDGENEIGPMTEEELIRNIQTKNVFGETLIWTEGMDNWAMIQDTQFVNYIPKVQTVQSRKSSSSKKVVMGISLALLLALGGMGFYTYHQKQTQEKERLVAETEKAKEEEEKAKEEAEKAEEAKKKAEEKQKESSKSQTQSNRNQQSDSRQDTTDGNQSSSNDSGDSTRYIGTYYSHVESGYLALRSSPERPADDSNVIGEMWTNGTEVKVINKQGTYWKVYVPSLGLTGYTDSRYLNER